MTTAESKNAPAGTRRRRPAEVRRAAAKMVMAANRANRKKTDPRIIAIAEGRQS